MYTVVNINTHKLAYLFKKYIQKKVVMELHKYEVEMCENYFKMFFIKIHKRKSKKKEEENFRFN